MEFSQVFLIGLERSVLPDGRSDEEEERRLLYVGFTRAKRQLYLSWADSRLAYGKYKPTEGASRCAHTRHVALCCASPR